MFMTFDTTITKFRTTVITRD